MRRWVAFPSRLPVVVVGAMSMPPRVTTTGSLQFKRPAYKKRHGGRQTAVHGHERSRGGDTALRDAALDGPEEEGGREKRARAEQDADAGRATAA